MNKITREVEIRNSRGLHARAAHAWVRAAEPYRCRLWVNRDGLRVDGRSAMALLTLAASRGTRLVLEAEGEDAESAISALCQLVNGKFGEEY